MQAIPTWLYGIIVVGGMGAYWYYTQGRHGKRALHHWYGLDEDEEFVGYPINGQYKIETKLAADIARGLVGVQKRGIFFSMALTNKGRISIRERENVNNPKAKFYYRENILGVELKEETKETTVGPKGKEKKVSVEIYLKDGDMLPILIGESSFYEIQKWFENK